MTFQEYFAAREIERDRHFEKLIENISNPRWKEVFYLAVEMLRRSDDFVRMMKDRIDGMLAHDEKLQAFLEWANQKTNSVQFSYKNVAIRSFYPYFESLAPDLNFDFYDPEFALDHMIDILKSEVNIDPNIEVNIDPDIDPDALNAILDITLALALAFDPALTTPNSTLVLDSDIALDHTLALALTHTRALDFSRELHRDPYHAIEGALARSSNLADGILQQALQALKSQLPSNPEGFYQWWENHGEEWTKKLRQVCIHHRNIGHDWQFIDEQVELLEQYYAANLLLVECMNRSYVSKQVREEIESTMLLPSKK